MECMQFLFCCMQYIMERIVVELMQEGFGFNRIYAIQHSAFFIGFMNFRSCLLFKSPLILGKNRIILMLPI